MAHNYDVGTRAWQPDAAEGWVASEVESKEIQGDKVKLVFRLENDEVCPMRICIIETGIILTFTSQVKVVKTNLAALQDDNNASLPPLMNPAILEASDDLTSLSHLNEPAGMKKRNPSCLILALLY